MSRLIILFFLLLPNLLKAQEPTIENGLEAFVQTHVLYPPYALEHCIQGSIEVAFKINAQGKITYATVTKGIGADLDAEALRLIKLSSGKWQVPVGYDTTSLIHSPIKFSLIDYGCEKVEEAVIGLSLRKYREHQQAVGRIVNFYKNIEQGVKNSERTATIDALKEELGIDESYLSKKIALAEKKIVQGDLQSACEDLKLAKYMGAIKANALLIKYCN